MSENLPQGVRSGRKERFKELMNALSEIVRLLSVSHCIQ